MRERERKKGEEKKLKKKVSELGFFERKTFIKLVSKVHRWVFTACCDIREANVYPTTGKSPKTCWRRRETKRKLCLSWLPPVVTAPFSRPLQSPGIVLWPTNTSLMKPPPSPETWQWGSHNRKKKNPPSRRRRRRIQFWHPVGAALARSNCLTLTSLNRERRRIASSFSSLPPPSGRLFMINRTSQATYRTPFLSAQWMQPRWITCRRARGWITPWQTHRNRCFSTGIGLQTSFHLMQFDINYRARKKKAFLHLQVVFVYLSAQNQTLSIQCDQLQSEAFWFVGQFLWWRRLFFFVCFFTVEVTNTGSVSRQLPL